MIAFTLQQLGSDFLTLEDFCEGSVEKLLLGREHS